MNRKTTKTAGYVFINTDRMNKLREEIMRNRGSVAHVGVLGDTNARWTDQMGNADIGAAHEFGVVSQNLPERSFLRMPLLQFLAPAIYKLGKEQWRKLILEKGLVAALKTLAVLGEAVVQDGFETGGFGMWPRLKPATVKAKGSSAILIDTAQLRQAVASRIVQAPSAP